MLIVLNSMVELVVLLNLWIVIVNGLGSFWIIIVIVVLGVMIRLVGFLMIIC